MIWTSILYSHDTTDKIEDANGWMYFCWMSQHMGPNSFGSLQVQYLSRQIKKTKIPLLSVLPEDNPKLTAELLIQSALVQLPGSCCSLVFLLIKVSVNSDIIAVSYIHFKSTCLQQHWSYGALRISVQMVEFSSQERWNWELEDRHVEGLYHFVAEGESGEGAWEARRVGGQYRA